MHPHMLHRVAIHSANNSWCTDSLSVHATHQPPSQSGHCSALRTTTKSPEFNTFVIKPHGFHVVTEQVWTRTISLIINCCCLTMCTPIKFPAHTTLVFFSPSQHNFISTGCAELSWAPMIKNITGILGWDSNHDVLLTSAEVLTNSTTKLACGKWPIWI